MLKSFIRGLCVATALCCVAVAQIQNPISSAGGGGGGVPASPATNALSSNVALNNTGTTFVGPTVARPCSVCTVRVYGQVEVTDATATLNVINCVLSDGVTSIASGFVDLSGTSPGMQSTVLPLSGQLTNPAGNLQIACKDATTVNGIIAASGGGGGNTASVISVERIS